MHTFINTGIYVQLKYIIFKVPIDIIGITLFLNTESKLHIKFFKTRIIHITHIIDILN